MWWNIGERGESDRSCHIEQRTPGDAISRYIPVGVFSLGLYPSHSHSLSTLEIFTIVVHLILRPHLNLCTNTGWKADKTMYPHAIQLSQLHSNNFISQLFYVKSRKISPKGGKIHCGKQLLVATSAPTRYATQLQLITAANTYIQYNGISLPHIHTCICNYVSSTYKYVSKPVPTLVNVIYMYARNIRIYILYTTHTQLSHFTCKKNILYVKKTS